MVTHEEAQKLIAELESRYDSDPLKVAAELTEVARTYYRRGDFPSAVAISRDAWFALG